jgi:hypothetical protein
MMDTDARTTQDPVADAARRAILRAAAEAYFDALLTNDLTVVPWAEQVRVHTPIAPGGPAEPLIGRDQVRSFFAAIAPGIDAVDVVTVYFSDDLRSVAAHAIVGMSQPPCRLRVVDRFDLDDDGRIVVQENHFDPRPALQ